jgi:hypothetical protein
VRHADNESAATILNSGVYRYFETGNKALATFKTDTLHCVELLTNELSEVVRPV